MPVTVRLFAVLALVAALVPVLPVDGLAVPDAFALVRLVAGETVIGVFFGLVARFYLLALSFAGQAVATMVGFAAIPGLSVTDDEPSAALATLISFSALVVLFQADFHHAVVRALVASYEAVPPFAPWRTGALLNDVAGTLAYSFAVALRLATPFVAYALVVNIAVGLVNKLAPQIPVYFVSLPFLIAGGLLLLYLLLPELLMLFFAGFGELAPLR